MLINGVPVECINQAALTYHVPAVMIASVLVTENGQVGMVRRNDNGTVDYGPMQINSLWLKTLKPYGYTAYDLQYNPCINVSVGAWILARNIANSGGTWAGVGDYHSHSLQQNQDYQTKVNHYYRFLTSHDTRQND